MHGMGNMKFVTSNLSLTYTMEQSPSWEVVRDNCKLSTIAAGTIQHLYLLQDVITDTKETSVLVR